MEKLWMGVTPGPLTTTEVVVTDASGQVLLRARLPHGPQHPRALATLCEALALWCGQSVHAALAVVGLDSFCATGPWLDTFDALTRGPLYEIEFVERAVAPHQEWQQT